MSNVRITGVLEDGTNRAPDIPRNTATTIKLQRFADASIFVRARRPSGVGINFNSFTTWTAYLTIVRQLEPCQAIPDLRVTGTLQPLDPEAPVLLFTISKNQFRKLDPRRYFFDVALVADGSQFELVRVGALIVQPGLLPA